jgi:hypothetical protein
MTAGAPADWGRTVERTVRDSAGGMQEQVLITIDAVGCVSGVCQGFFRGRARGVPWGCVKGGRWGGRQLMGPGTAVAETSQEQGEVPPAERRRWLPPSFSRRWEVDTQSRAPYPDSACSFSEGASCRTSLLRDPKGPSPTQHALLVVFGVGCQPLLRGGRANPLSRVRT